MSPRASSRPSLLVTYDGSKASLPALDAAARVASKMKGEVILLRVHHPALNIAVNPDIEERERMMEEVEERMLTELEALAGDLEGKVRPVVRRLGQRWNVVDEILKTADEFDVEMICMATHGDSPVRHFIAGSTSLAVLSKSERPVLLVRSSD
jgi:nucleotide-binding universal stress UspA family protein